MQTPKNVIGAIYNCQSKKQISRPLFATGVSAGTPSPADDSIEQQLNLNAHLIRNPEKTYFAKISGESMIDAGIYDDDILVIDRSIDPIDGKIVVAMVDDELTVKRLTRTEKGWILKSENTAYPSIEVGATENLMVWGVVTNAIHNLY